MDTTEMKITTIQTSYSKVSDGGNSHSVLAPPW